MPERTKGTACKAVKPRVQIPPGAPFQLQQVRGSAHEVGCLADRYRGAYG